MLKNLKFELLDEDQLHDLIESADSKNTRNVVKWYVAFVGSLLMDYLKYLIT